MRKRKKKERISSVVHTQLLVLQKPRANCEDLNTGARYKDRRTVMCDERPFALVGHHVLKKIGLSQGIELPKGGYLCQKMGRLVSRWHYQNLY